MFIFGVINLYSIFVKNPVSENSFIKKYPEAPCHHTDDADGYEFLPGFSNQFPSKQDLW